jgi:hypothetical protein
LGKRRKSAHKSIWGVSSGGVGNNDLLYHGYGLLSEIEVLLRGSADDRFVFVI